MGSISLGDRRNAIFTIKHLFIAFKQGSAKTIIYPRAILIARLFSGSRVTTPSCIYVYAGCLRLTPIMGSREFSLTECSEMVNSSPLHSGLKSLLRQYDEWVSLEDIFFLRIGIDDPKK